MASKLSVWAPKTPGAEPTVIGMADTMDEARALARTYHDRRDLRRHDIEIRLADTTDPEDGSVTLGQRIEFAGPAH